MWINVEDCFKEEKIKAVVDCTKPGRVDGTLLYDGKLVSKFGIDLTYDEDGEYDGFSIDVPFRKATEMFDDDDVIYMIEYAMFDSEDSDKICDVESLARGGE